MEEPHSSTPQQENSTQEKARLVVDPIRSEAYEFSSHQPVQRVLGVSQQLLELESSMLRDAEQAVRAGISWASAPLNDEVGSMAAVPRDLATDVWDRAFFDGFGYVLATTAMYVDHRHVQVAEARSQVVDAEAQATGIEAVRIDTLIESEIRGALITEVRRVALEDETFRQRLSDVLNAFRAAEPELSEVARQFDVSMPDWKAPEIAIPAWQQVAVGSLTTSIELLGRYRCSVTVVPGPRDGHVPFPEPEVG